MMKLLAYVTVTTFFLLSAPVFAKDEVELETTFIRGNKELPQVLYVIPWKDMKQDSHKQEIIVLHSLFGDLFEPVTPDDLAGMIDDN